MLSDLERQWWNDKMEPPPVPETSGEAIAALIFGICGLCILPVIGPIAALILGYHARAEVDGSPGRISGRGLAVAGIILGWIGLAIAGFWIYVVLFGAISFSPA